MACRGSAVRIRLAPLIQSPGTPRALVFELGKASKPKMNPLVLDRLGDLGFHLAIHIGAHMAAHLRLHLSIYSHLTRHLGGNSARNIRSQRRVELGHLHFRRR